MGQNRAVVGATGVPRGGLEGFFRLREHGTDARTEVLAGLTTFFVKSYLIAVNPALLVAAGLDVRAVATSTCLVAGLFSIAMGLYTNRAFALAPGLGLNAIVAYNLVGTLGLTPAEAMGVVVVEGVLITILVLLGVRKYVMDVIPAALSRAIAAGIGFATVIAFLVPGDVARLPAEPLAGPDFSLIGQFSFGFFAKLGLLTAVLTVISFMLSDFFDTMGTLIGVGSEAGYLNDRGELEDAQRPLLIDSLGAVAGGALSASSATTYIESAAGVAAGGRTGLVSVVTGLLFLLALPFVALVGAIPAVATAPALIVVGVLMVGVLSEGAAGRRVAIDFRNLDDAVPVVLTMLVMPLTFSITNGIGAGFVSYVLIKLASGKGRQVHPVLYVVAAAFLLYFLRWALFNARF